MNTPTLNTAADAAGCAPLTFWTFNDASRKAHVGRCREFGTPGEARAYERGWYDGACGVAIETHIDSYMKGFYDRESEVLERFDEQWIERGHTTD